MWFGKRKCDWNEGDEEDEEEAEEWESEWVASEVKQRVWGCTVTAGDAVF